LREMNLNKSKNMNENIFKSVTLCFSGVAAVILLQVAVLHAQDLKSPTGFYGSDFVTEREKERQKKEESLHKEKNIEDNTRGPMLERGDDAGFRQLGEEKDIPEHDTTDSDRNVMHSARGVPVSFVSLVVNGLETDHAYEMIHQLSELCLKYKITPGMIYVVGMLDIHTDAPYDYARVVARGGGFKLDAEVLDKYKISHSPSWIVVTEKGDVVLEGVSSIDKFFNGRGMFIESYLES